jgi:hypothetical protein
MASQNPIHTLSTPKPVERPRAKPLVTAARSVGYERSKGLSDHSGRQGRIISITPRVAHKNTNSSTPMRRSHTRATEGLGLGTETGAGGEGASAADLNSPAAAESRAKGSLGSEIIARVVIGRVVSKAVGLTRDRIAPQRKFRTHLLHSTTSKTECARRRRDNRCWNRRQW